RSGVWQVERPADEWEFPPRRYKQCGATADGHTVVTDQQQSYNRQRRGHEINAAPVRQGGLHFFE
ncbi:MAG TPA: hypothetical protein VGE93_22795, partial [Bryobacteraceae bacterium]